MKKKPITACELEDLEEAWIEARIRAHEAREALRDKEEKYDKARVAWQQAKDAWELADDNRHKAHDALRLKVGK